MLSMQSLTQSVASDAKRDKAKPQCKIHPDIIRKQGSRLVDCYALCTGYKGFDICAAHGEGPGLGPEGGTSMRHNLKHPAPAAPQVFIRQAIIIVGSLPVLSAGSIADTWNETPLRRHAH